MMILMHHNFSNRIILLFRNAENYRIFLFSILLSIVEGFHALSIIKLPYLFVFTLNFIFIAFIPGYVFLRTVIKWRKNLRTVFFSFIFSMLIVPVLVMLPTLVFGEMSWWMPILMVDAYLSVLFLLHYGRKRREEPYFPTMGRLTIGVFLTCLAFVGVYFAFQGNYWFEYCNSLVTRTPHDADVAYHLAVIQGFMKEFPTYSPFLAGELELWKSFSLQLFFYAIIFMIPGISSVASAAYSVLFLDIFVSVLFAALLFYLCLDILGDWKTGVLSIIMYAFGTSVANPLRPGNEGFPQITRDIFFAGGHIETTIWEPAFVLNSPGGHIYFGTYHLPSFILMFSIIYFIGLFLAQSYMRYCLVQCILSIGLSLTGWPYYALYFVSALSIFLLLGGLQRLLTKRSGIKIPVFEIFFLITITVVSILVSAYLQYSMTRVGIHGYGIIAEKRLPFHIVVLNLVDGITHFFATLGACLPLGLVGLFLLYKTKQGYGFLHISLVVALFSLFFLTDIYSKIDLQHLIAVSLYISSSFAVFVLMKRINSQRRQRTLLYILLLLLFSSRLIFFASFFGQYTGEVLGREFPIQTIQNIVPPYYISMCDWVRENTHEKSIFLVCPYDPMIPFFSMFAGRAVLCAHYPYYYDLENYRDANRIYSLMKSAVFVGNSWSPPYSWEGELYRNVTIRNEEKSGFSVMLDPDCENNIIQIDYMDVNSKEMMGNQYIEILAQDKKGLTKIGIIKLDGTYTLKSILVSVPEELISNYTAVYEKYFTFSETYNFPISRIFVSSNLDTVTKFLGKYHLEYVVVSEGEKIAYNTTSFDFESFPNLFNKVYDKDNINIYKFHNSLTPETQNVYRKA